MTPEEMRNAAEVLLAAANKKQIQYYSNDCCWITCADTNFDFNRWKFRIKPEPRETWNNFYKQGPSISYASKQEAHDAAKNCHRHDKENTAVHMREVLDE